MLFGSLLLAAIVGNLLLFVPPIQSVSKCALVEEQLEFSCPFVGSSLVTTPGTSPLETEDEPDNYAPLRVPQCFEKKPEKKSKFGSNSALRPNQNRPAKIMNLRFSHCRVQCRLTDANRGLRWRDKAATEFRGPGFCLTSEEFESENCFPATNETLLKQLQFSLDLSMNSLPIANRFESSIHSINRDEQLTDGLVRNRSINRYQRINCLGREDCKIVCPIEKATSLPNLQQIKVVDARSHFITFWTYLVLRVLMVIIIATEMSLLKAAILTMVNANDSEYGYQRVWASYAVCVIPMISGIIMDRLIANGSTQTFSPCFYLFR